MIKYYPLIISIEERLNELNDKLNELIGSKTDNVVVGALIFGALLVIAYWGIGELNRQK